MTNPFLCCCGARATNDASRRGAAVDIKSWCVISLTAQQFSVVSDADDDDDPYETTISHTTGADAGDTRQPRTSNEFRMFAAGPTCYYCIYTTVRRRLYEESSSSSSAGSFAAGNLSWILMKRKAHTKLFRGLQLQTKDLLCILHTQLDSLL